MKFELPPNLISQYPAITVPSWLKLTDWLVVTSMLALLTMGLVTLASISFGTEQSYFIHQVVFAMISLVAFVGIMRSDYQQLIKLSPIFYAVNCLLLVLVGLVGHVSHGAASWLQLGPLNIQPSEIAKISLLLMLTWFVAYSRQRQWRWPRLLAGMCLIALPYIALVVIQPDIGTASVLVVIWLLALWLSPIPKRVLAGVGVSLLLAAALSWTVMAPYQQQRLATFLHPTEQPLGAGYNVVQSQIAVGSGMWFGQGWGRGTQSHLQFLPEHHSDFIFAALSEEMGFIGSMAVLVFICILAWRCLRLAWHSNDQSVIIISAGITAMLVYQAGINIGMNIGLAPVTGLPLPLVSYGGSSLLTTIIGLGVVASMYRHDQLTRPV